LSAERCQLDIEIESLKGKRTLVIHCNRPVKRNGKCIFHLEDKSDEEDKLFEEDFWKELKRMEEDDDIPVLDFTGFVFPDSISFKCHKFKKPVDFSYAKFGLADFIGTWFTFAKFYNTKFREVDFKNAVFDVAAVLHSEFGKADFLLADFNIAAYFYETKFGEVRFAGATFDKAHFSAVKSNKAYFMDAHFDQAYFINIKLDEANFTGANFKNATFLSATFNWVSFWKSEFFGSARFEETGFSSDEKVIPSKFRDVKFHKPNEVVFRRVDLSNVSFLHTDVSEIEFSDVKWARKEGRFGSRNIVVDETLIGKDPEVDYESVAQLYRRLRKNYESNYRFAEAGDFFIGEMEMRRLNVNTRFKNKILRKIILWVKRNLSLTAWYKYLGYYGESTLYPAAWAAGTILFFSLLNHLTQAGSLSVEEYLKALTNSIATFFQLRSETTFDIFERLLSVPILGLFFMALKRKFERRK
jgi:uncharacterized protein YjbI with pentapeptide repeats